MDIREALYTTRAMRRVRPDPIPEEVQAKILDAAIRAPTGGNGFSFRTKPTFAFCRGNFGSAVPCRSRSMINSHPFSIDIAFDHTARSSRF